MWKGNKICNGCSLLNNVRANGDSPLQYNLSMNYNPKNHHRRSIRLKEFDYSQPGWYYVTICTQNKKCLFGAILKSKMVLNEYGKIVEEEWLKTKEIRKNIDLDYYCVMPNHLHGIIIIENKIVGANSNSPLQYNYENKKKLISPSQTIGAIVRGFKGAVTKQINGLRNTPGNVVWQRNYFEHILRKENDLYNTRNYIQNNPLKWELDELFSENNK